MGTWVVPEIWQFQTVLLYGACFYWMFRFILSLSYLHCFPLLLALLEVFLEVLLMALVALTWLPLSEVETPGLKLYLVSPDHAASSTHLAGGKHCPTGGQHLSLPSRPDLSEPTVPR